MEVDAQGRAAGSVGGAAAAEEGDAAGLASGAATPQEQPEHPPADVLWWERPPVDARVQDCVEMTKGVRA